MLSHKLSQGHYEELKLEPLPQMIYEGKVIKSLYPCSFPAHSGPWNYINNFENREICGRIVANILNDYENAYGESHHIEHYIRILLGINVSFDYKKGDVIYIYFTNMPLICLAYGYGETFLDAKENAFEELKKKLENREYRRAFFWYLIENDAAMYILPFEIGAVKLNNKSAIVPEIFPEFSHERSVLEEIDSSIISEIKFAKAMKSIKKKLNSAKKLRKLCFLITIKEKNNKYYNSYIFLGSCVVARNFATTKSRAEQKAEEDFEKMFEDNQKLRIALTIVCIAFRITII